MSSDSFDIPDVVHAGENNSPVIWETASRAETHQRGQQLATILRAGDVIVLSGALGAGKTAFTQGIGAGLGVQGQVASPTFVIARFHPSGLDAPEAPALVHVDAYRLGGVVELDDLDLDTDVDESVTVIEWGEGIAERLADEHLLIRIDRFIGNAEISPSFHVVDDASSDLSEPRYISLLPHGRIWSERLKALGN